MKKKQAYFIGIKGVAMTALAVYLKERGYGVSGSDVEDIFPTDKILQKYSIPVKKGFTPKNLTGSYDLVIATGAHGGKTNPEAQEAIRQKFRFLMHGQALGYFMKEHIGISVAGSHGKTTTTSIIASLLVHSGLDPSYAVGTAEINDLGSAGHAGKGHFFVAEADEYMTCPLTDPTPRFLWQNPRIAVITNIEYDHPDAFSDIKDVESAFLHFAQKLPKTGVLVVCLDSDQIRKILPFVSAQIITYGFSPQADYTIENSYFGDDVSFMRVKHQPLHAEEFMLKIPGKHNMLNALAASIAANQAGVGWDMVKENLKIYTGNKRRFEKIGQIGSILLYDDYAHHPSEIAATIQAAKKWFSGRRVVILFQPHTYSRTKTLLSNFAKCFSEADSAVITDIYPSAREKFDSSVSSEMLVIESKKYKNNCTYQAKKEDVLSYLESHITKTDVIITMGAGDIYLWHKDILTMLRRKAS